MFARNSVITDCSSRQDNWRTGQLDGAPRQSLQARLNRKAADSPASKPTATQQSTGTGDRPAPSKQPSYRCRCEVHQHRGSPGSLEAAHQELQRSSFWTIILLQFVELPYSEKIIRWMMPFSHSNTVVNPTFLLLGLFSFLSSLSLSLLLPYS